MGAAENVAKLKDAYRQWHETKGRSEKVWLDLMADDITIMSLAQGRPERVAFTGQTLGKSGKTQMQEYFAGLRSDWEMNWYRVLSYIAEGDRVAVQCDISWTFKQHDQTFETLKADFWTFRDGKAVEFSEYYDTAALFAATADPDKSDKRPKA